MESWDQRERRTSQLIRKCYEAYIAPREPTADQIYALCQLTWLSKGGGELVDNTASVISPAFSELSNTEIVAQTRSELVEKLVVLDAPEAIVRLAALPAGIVNYYNGFRNIARTWLRNHHATVWVIVRSVLESKTDADVRHAFSLMDTLPPLPRPKAGDGKPRNLLTPLLACLNPRGRTPIINDRKVWLLSRLGLTSSSLAEQHDGLVNLINQGGIRDAFDLDVADEEQIDAAMRSKASDAHQHGGTSSKPLGERCDDDVEYMHRADIVTMRHRHNSMTNALRAACAAADLHIEEGSDKTCLFDALLRGYSGAERHLLLEVKTDDAAPMCRMAVGQLFDYRRQLSDRAAIDLGVLFPSKPSASTRDFLNYVGVKALWFDEAMTSVLGDVRLGGRVNATRQDFTPEQLDFMTRTYGRILTPEEWDLRASRFVSDGSDLRYGEDGILEIS